MSKGKKRRSEQRRLLLGIGIDEGVRFALCELGASEVLSVDEIIEAPFDGTPSAQGIEDVLARLCASLAEEDLERILAVSFSSIGNIDVSHQGAMNIIRPGWGTQANDRHIDFVGMLGRCMPDELMGKRAGTVANIGQAAHREVYVTNDATCAAIGEYLCGHPDLRARITGERRRDIQQVFAYIRVGAGVNIGLVINGLPWRGQLHPEFGHIRPRAYEAARGRAGHVWRDDFKGVCEAHGACYEGLLCREALEMRLGKDVPLDDMMAHYLAQMCVLVTMTLAPERIVIGGSGITGRVRLLDGVRAHFRELCRNYPSYGAMHRLEQFISEARCEGYANVLGALAIGRRALERSGAR